MMKNGGEKMKRTFIVVPLTLFLASIIAISSASTVTALTDVEHQTAYGSTVISINGHPQILFDGFHLESSDIGAGDVIKIWYYTGLPSPMTYLPIAIFTDIPSHISFFRELYGNLPTSIQLVDSSSISAFRLGNTKIITVFWKIALEVPDEHWGPKGAIVVPSMSIPPGLIIFKGHGDAIPGSSTSYPNPLYGQTWTQTVTWTGYSADALFMCPNWHFGGLVGENEGQYQTNIRTYSTITSTK
jgi:hypothetical protein